MVAAAIIVHRVGGRTRFKIAAERGNAAYFQHVRNALEQCPGVDTVSTNVTTASLLLHHSAPLEQIVEFARRHALFDSDRSPPAADSAASSLLNRLAEDFNRLDARATSASRGALDSRSLLFLGLLALIALQIARGQVLGPVSSLVWYVLELLRAEGWGKR